MNRESTADALARSIGKTIQSASILMNDEEQSTLNILFTDGASLNLWDEPDCCENRWFSTDDDLSSIAGDTLLGIEELPVSEENDGELGEEAHNINFVAVRTSKSVVTLACHNQHNGYYGGFCLSAELKEPTT